MIRINCSGCGGILTIPVDLAGTEAKCPGCKVSFLVPDQPSDDEQPETSDDAESNEVDSESSDFDPMDILNEPTPQKRGVHVTPREPRLESAAPAASEPEKELPRTDTDTAAAAVDAMAAMNRGPRPTKATAPVTPTTSSATTAVPRFNLREAFASPENFFDAISESKIYVVLAVCLLAAFVFYMPKGCDTGVPRYPVSGRVLFTDGTPVKLVSSNLNLWNTSYRQQDASTTMEVSRARKACLQALVARL